MSLRCLCDVSAREGKKSGARTRSAKGQTTVMLFHICRGIISTMNEAGLNIPSYELLDIYTGVIHG